MQYCVDFHIKQKIYLGWYLQKPIWSVDIPKQPAWFMTFMKFMMCYNPLMTEVPSYWNQSIDLRNFPNIDSNLSHEWVKSFKIIFFFSFNSTNELGLCGGKVNKMVSYTRILSMRGFNYNTKSICHGLRLFILSEIQQTFIANTQCCFNDLVN